MNKLDEELVGLTIYETNNPAIRATIIDGRPQVVTMDHDTSRINVEVKDGKIIKILPRG